MSPKLIRNFLKKKAFSEFGAETTAESAPFPKKNRVPLESDHLLDI